jgi:hypothetical protein
MKRCIIVLLSSCLTQGIGWFFGPFLTNINPTAGQVLGWFFIVFNALEGFWAIILYIIIRSQHMDEQKRVISLRDDKKLKSRKSDKYKNLSTDVNKNESGIEKRSTEVVDQDIEQQISYLFDDLHDLQSMSWPVNDDDDDDIIRSYF